tara:strand:- start:745 stop:1512 length:768 start_codon:yes stop_codon:yes gene_type:complete
MTWNLVTFANENFYDRQNYLEKYAEKLGMGSYSYTHEWLKEQDFYEENKNILQDETGLGYFLWKSYIINDAINKMEDGDVLFYTDVGDIFTPSLVQYVESIMEDDPCLLIKGNFKNKDWTRRDCFVYMDCDEEDYWESPQLEGGMSFWRVCDQSKEIIAEWLKFASDRRIVSDDENVCGKDNFPTFKEHRWDQSILTNLAVKNGLSVAPEDIRGYIECNYDYWYERYGKGGAPTYRPVDKFLLEKKDELMGLYNA